MKLYFNPTSTLSLCGHRAVNPPIRLNSLSRAIHGDAVRCF
jgi:hypothetical protein